MTDTLTLHELNPRKNWPSGRMPENIDERTRLYTGFRVTVAAREWRAIVVHFDGERTTAYVTNSGFDLEHHGPAIEQAKGRIAKYRRVLIDWFREQYGREVRFA